MDRRTWDQAGPEAFSRGLKRIGTATRQVIDTATLDVYAEAMCPQTDPQEWAAFVLETIAAGRWQWFPKVQELVDALREFRGQSSLESEAVRAYERVLDAGEYVAESGTTWTFRRVNELCGRAAAEAFLEAGGHHAFAWGGRDEPRRRERFVEAYQQTARDAPSTRLLEAKPTNLLAPVEFRPVSRDEADKVMAELKRHVLEDVRNSPDRPAGLVVKDEGRVAVLLEQARAMGVTPESIRAARETSEAPEESNVVEVSEERKRELIEMVETLK